MRSSRWAGTRPTGPATVRGYRDLRDCMRSHGELVVVGVEGTGAYGAEPARVLAAAR